ncbi:MAG TPA: hypothetical protein VNN19_01225, partial [bacterium]|nr:hypothetical protein [bacterium]
MKEQQRQPTVEPQPESHLAPATPAEGRAEGLPGGPAAAASPVGPEAKRKPPAKGSNHRKRFSVTIQVPEDVVERWPEWFTTERLMGEVFQAAALAAAAARARRV